jgi:hypothetical protein
LKDQGGSWRILKNSPLPSKSRIMQDEVLVSIDPLTKRYFSLRLIGFFSFVLVLVVILVCFA